MTEFLRAALLSCTVVAGSVAAAAPPRAEVQINLCSDPDQVVRALGLRSAQEATTVWLFDTRSLELHREGLRLRLRLQGDRNELTLKVAGQDCSALDVRSLRGHGKCEADLHGASFDDVVSLSRSLTRDEVRTLLQPAPRATPLAEALWALLNDRQRQFAAGRRTVGNALPREPLALGPSRVRSYRSSQDAYVVEVWSLPAGQQFIELSERATRDTAVARRTQLLDRIAAAGLTTCADQESQAGEKLRRLAE